MSVFATGYVLDKTPVENKVPVVPPMVLLDVKNAPLMVKVPVIAKLAGVGFVIALADAALVLQAGRVPEYEVPSIQPA